MFQVNAVTARIARMWLNSLPRAQQGRQRGFDVSDDDSSSSDGEPARARGVANIPQALPQPSRRILQLWLQQIR